MRDPYFNDILLNVRGFGRDVIPFRDNGPLNTFPRFVGSDIVADASSKFGGGFMFSNNGGSYIEFQRPPILGTDDFTIEAWIRPTFLNSASGTIATTYNTASGTRPWALYLRPNGSLYFRLWYSDLSISSATGLILKDKNYHVAACRSGNMLRLFINGTMVKESPFTVNLNSSYHVALGKTPFDNSDYYTGSIEDFKITKVAKYVSNFDPPQEITPTYYGGVPPNLAGTGKIAGAVKIKGVALEGAECILFNEVANMPLLYSTTDSAGRFEFTGLNKDELFYVVVKQNDTSWEHIVSSRRNPA